LTHWPKAYCIFRATMTSQPGPTLLLKIPLEIRYHIYSFLISTPRTISVNLHAESQHAHSKKIIIIIKRGQLILKSLSETCKQLHLEIPVWASPYSNYSITNAFGIIDPRITSFKIRFLGFMVMEGCEEWEECQAPHIWAFNSPLSPTGVKMVIDALQIFSGKIPS
jgi:hypothetical protein